MNWLLYGIFALDRNLRLVPSLIQVWLGEFLMIVPAALFVGAQLASRGALSCPGDHRPITGALWGGLGLSVICAGFFLKNVIRPTVRIDEWSPVVRTGLSASGVELLAHNSRAKVTYPFLSSHPAYSLLLLLTMWVPLALYLQTEGEGCSTLFWRASGIVGLAIVPAVAAIRFIAWYVLGLGGDILKAHNFQGIPPARVAWEMAWKPVLMLVVLMHLIAWIPLGALFWNQHAKINKLPVVTVTSPASAATREYFRVTGTVKGEPVYWFGDDDPDHAARNYAGVGVLIALDSGGEALVVAGREGYPELLNDWKAAKAKGRFQSSGYVVQGFDATQVKYYKFSQQGFPAPDPGGRVLVVHGTP